MRRKRAPLSRYADSGHVADNFLSGPAQKPGGADFPPDEKDIRT